MKVQPRQLKMLDPETLQIQWSDGQTRSYGVRHLRENCPVCELHRKEQRSAPTCHRRFPVLSTAEAQPLRIAHMEPMGRYAYSIRFSDGHDTGLYTLDALRELGEKTLEFATKNTK